eukprot:42600-Prymnesium_polylepis.2
MLCLLVSCKARRCGDLTLMVRVITTWTGNILWPQPSSRWNGRRVLRRLHFMRAYIAKTCTGATRPRYAPHPSTPTNPTLPPPTLGLGDLPMRGGTISWCVSDCYTQSQKRGPGWMNGKKMSEI